MIRDLNDLLEQGLVSAEGVGRATTYTLTLRGRQEVVVDLEAYRRQLPSSRLRLAGFTPELAGVFGGVLSGDSLHRVQAAQAEYVARRQEEPLYDAMARRALEHFTIELSWISSKFEGNTYTVFETERLIKEGVTAPGHSPYEARMILNHKRAIEHIWTHQADYRTITRQQVLEVHQLLTAGLEIPQGIRPMRVRITGTAYEPPVGQAQLAAYLDDVISTVNDVKEPAEKGLACLALLAYLQPFADGNKRTSRLMANAVLLAHDYPPLSFFTATEEAYKDAMLVFYEQGTVGNLRQLFVEQLEYASHHYLLRPDILERRQPERGDPEHRLHRGARERADDVELEL